MLSSPNIDRTQYVTETVQCRFTTNSIICFGHAESIFHTKFYLPVRITLSRHRPRHFKLGVMSVLARNNIWCGVRVLLVVAWRTARSCLAMSCSIKQHHGRYSQGAAPGAPQPGERRN